MIDTGCIRHCRELAKLAERLTELGVETDLVFTDTQCKIPDGRTCPIGDCRRISDAFGGCVIRLAYRNAVRRFPIEYMRGVPVKEYPHAVDLVHAVFDVLLREVFPSLGGLGLCILHPCGNRTRADELRVQVDDNQYWWGDAPIVSSFASDHRFAALAKMLRTYLKSDEWYLEHWLVGMPRVDSVDPIRNVLEESTPAPLCHWNWRRPCTSLWSLLRFMLSSLDSRLDPLMFPRFMSLMKAFALLDTET